MTAHPQDTATKPVERFRPTSGRIVGYTTLAVLVGLLVYIAVDARTLTGLRVALGLAFFGVLVWATQLRPRATAYPRSLELKNSFRDTTIPLTMVDEVSVHRTLSVRAGERSYVCIGIGQSLRRMVKSKSSGPSSLLGFDRLESYHRDANLPRPDQTTMAYSAFVVARIEGLVQDAKRSARGTTDQRLQRAWAWPEIIALVVTGLAFVVALAL